MRAVSTVFDVTICLLLVSAAVLVLTLPMTEPDPESVADETATVLSGSTTTVTYSAFGDTAAEAERFHRQRHGTFAGLAGRAALAATAIDGTPVAPESMDFRAQVREEVEATIPARTAVTARWEPYPDAPLSGQFEGGVQPPENADVQVAVRTVPISELTVNPGDDFEAISQKLSETFVRELVPTTAGERPTHDDASITAIAGRYEVLAGESFGARELLLEAEMEPLVEQATDGLAARLETDMRERFDSPEEAADAIAAGHAWIQVQRWEP